VFNTLNILLKLKTVKRPEVVEKIKVARSFGDLSENSEYDAAKDEQGLSKHVFNTLNILLNKTLFIFSSIVF
jgi:transcription elongation factor GreA